jgi:hypothetical protein
MSDAHLWQPHLGGSTLGMDGQTGGTISRDESLPGERARLTLEEAPERSYFALTCTVAGWLVYTRSFDAAAPAHAALEEMQPALLTLLERLPGRTPPPPPAEVRRAGELLAAFMVRFP